jgi:hypothetical protein
MSIIQILAALYLVFIGTIMNTNNMGWIPALVFKVVPVVLGILVAFPVLKQFL